MSLASAIHIQLPGTLKSLAQQQSEVSAHGATVGEVIADLERQYPGFAAQLLEGDKLARYLNLYLNERDVRFAQQLATPVKGGDEIVILTAVAGGSARA